MTEKQIKKLTKASDIMLIISTIVLALTTIWFNMEQLMQINRKYFQKSNTVYVFPVGFIQDNEVFDKEFIKEYTKELNKWKKRLSAN